jgi:dTDP-4-dehydrorhamnose 3,5-epimerase
MSEPRVKSLGLEGVFTLLPIRSEQANGRFSHYHSERELAAFGAASHFVQEHASRYAARHTVRGLHFQTLPRPQTKVVRVARGRILDVVVDIRRGSRTFGRHAAVELADDWTQLHVPAGFAHGFCTLEPDTEIVFRLTDYNDPALLRGLAWDDSALAIDWPCGAAPGFVFEVDRGWPTLARLDSPFAVGDPAVGESPV